LGKTVDHTTLRGQHSLARCLGQKLHVLGQHPVLCAGAGVDPQEALNEFAQLLRWRQRQGRHTGLQRLEPRHVLAGDLREQIVFVAHVVVERGLAQAAGGCDLLHGGGGIAAAGKELSGGCQHLLVLVGITVRSRPGHGRALNARRRSK